MSALGSTPETGGASPLVRQCGELAFDFGRRVVTRGEVPLDLSGAYLAALFLLIERSPQAVPKAELSQAAGTTEDTFYKVIETIRKALGDSEEPRRLIVTERGVGYRFIGKWNSPASDRSESLTVPGSDTVATVRKSLKMRLAPVAIAAVLSLAALLGTVAIIRHGDSRPVAMLAVEGPFLVARDASGKEVWRHLFERGFDPLRYTQSLMAGRYWLGDLNGDGNQEALFLYDASADPHNHRHQESSSLVCFSQAGRVKWTFQVGRVVRDQGGDIHPPFRAEGMLVLFSAGPHRESRIIVGSGHTTDQPYQLAFLDASGRLVAEYWHPGSLYLLTSIPAGPAGAPRLLAGGVNNGEHRATFVELDPFGMSGISTPSRMKDQKFRLLDMPEAREELVVLFPRTCLSHDEPYTRLSGLAVDDGGVRVNVIESYNPGSHRDVFYDFDRSLHLSRASLSSDWREEHLRLEQSGAIHHSWREDEAGLVPGLEYRPKAP